MVPFPLILLLIFYGKDDNVTISIIHNKNNKSLIDCWSVIELQQVKSRILLVSIIL